MIQESVAECPDWPSLGCVLIKRRVRQRFFLGRWAITWWGENMRNLNRKTLAVVFRFFLFTAPLSASANAAPLPSSLPGQVLWTYYQTIQAGQVCSSTSVADFATTGFAIPFEGGAGTLCNTASEGDNIVRLINPNNAANDNLGNPVTGPSAVCAMIYIFDDDEEMGECCGCPLTPAQLATFSVENDLTSNWGVAGGPEGGAHGSGAIVIVAVEPNALNAAAFSPPTGNNAHGCSNKQSNACNSPPNSLYGCDPTNLPGYSPTAAVNLLGSITHNQFVQQGERGNEAAILGITETALSDNANGGTVVFPEGISANVIYLQTQCGALVGNGTGGGICNCPTE